MITVTKTYTDFDGNERTEDFRFGFTQAEVAKMELSTKGGLTYYMDEIVKAQDTPRLIELFTELIDKSYGIKSADGRTFKKSQEALEDFKATNAYSQIFMEVALDVNKASEFIVGIMPPETQRNMAEAFKAGTMFEGDAQLNSQQRNAIEAAMKAVSEKSVNDNNTAQPAIPETKPVAEANVTPITTGV